MSKYKNKFVICPKRISQKRFFNFRLERNKNNKDRLRYLDVLINQILQRTPKLASPTYYALTPLF